MKSIPKNRSELPGLLTESYDKLMNERPEYFVFNGHVGALTEHYPLKANVGETVRIFFGVGGPNFTSSFHVIGEIFDRAYQLGSVTSPPVTDVQSISVPPGSANLSSSSSRCPVVSFWSTTLCRAPNAAWQATSSSKAREQGHLRRSAQRKRVRTLEEEG